MERTMTLLAAGLIAFTSLQAQTTDLVFFTDDGAKFTLVIDGEVKNDVPASRVLAVGVRNETPMVIVRFEEATIPQLRKQLYYPLGMEYTTMITLNKKGERVFRPTGEAALGTAAKAEPAKPRPAEFVEDGPAAAPVAPAVPATLGITQQVDMGGSEQVTTVVDVTEDTVTPDGGSMQINMGVNGVGINMGVTVNDGTMGAGTGTSTTTRTTTRTTTTVTTTGGPTTVVTAPTTVAKPAPVTEAEPYRMPGYSGPIGCAMPMTSAEFAEARKSIEGQSFEDTKMTMARQVGRDRCFSTDQVKSMMGVFSFEDSKLEFAKFAYDRTHDVGNYYKINDAFTFSSSVEELNEYIGSR